MFERYTIHMARKKIISGEVAVVTAKVPAEHLKGIKNRSKYVRELIRADATSNTKADLKSIQNENNVYLSKLKELYQIFENNAALIAPNCSSKEIQVLSELAEEAKKW